MLRLPACREVRGADGLLAFRGPRVRMGIHFAAEGTIAHRHAPLHVMVAADCHTCLAPLSKYLHVPGLMRSTKSLCWSGKQDEVVITVCVACRVV